MKNLIISLSTIVLKMLTLMFGKINLSELKCCMDEMDVIFKLATSLELMSLLFPSNIRFSEHLRTLVKGLDIIDRIFKVVTQHEHDDASDLNKSFGFD